MPVAEEPKMDPPIDEPLPEKEGQDEEEVILTEAAQEEIGEIIED